MVGGFGLKRKSNIFSARKNGRHSSRYKVEKNVYIKKIAKFTANWNFCTFLQLFIALRAKDASRMTMQ